MLLLTFGVAPILAIVIGLMPYKTLRRSFCKTRFGVLYEEIKIRKNINKIYPLIFFLRRIIIVVVTVLVEYHMSLELLTLFYINLFIFIFVGNQDLYKDKKFHKLIIFNEMAIYELTF